MSNVLSNFIAKKKIGFYFTAAAALFILLAMICVIVTGSEQNDLTAGMVIMFIIGIAAAGVTMYKDFFGIGLLASCVCTGVGLMMLVVPRLNMIGLILNNVVEQQIPAAFIAAIVFTVLAMVCNCVSGFTGVEKKNKF